MVPDPGVDARGVGAGQPPRPGRHGLGAPAGGAPQVEGPEEPVRLEGRLAEDLGQRAPGGPPEELHLPQPVRGVEPALGPVEVVLGGGGDVGDGEAVATDGDRRLQPPDLHGPVGRRQRRAEPEPPRGDAPGREDEEEDVSLFNRVGDLEVRLGKIERAVQHYERAVDLYVEAELPNNAIAVCKKVVRNVPEAEAPDRLVELIRERGAWVDPPAP